MKKLLTMISLFGLVCLVLPRFLSAACPVQLSPEDYTYFKTYQLYKDAPKLANLPDAKKRVKIAENLKISVSRLNTAIQNGLKAGNNIEELVKTSIQEALAETPLKDKVLDVTINTQTEHAVAFIKWRAQNPLDFDKEACYGAFSVKEGGPFISIAVLWAVNNNDVTVFSAKAGRSAFEKISKSQINNFASTRYIKMFEEVKRGPQK